MKPIVTVHGSAPQWMLDIVAEEFTRALNEYGFTAHIPQTPFRQAAPKGPFLWLTHGGLLLRPKDMATPHLYYALRMIFNHSVPEEFRTPESLHSVKQYNDVPKWSRSYRKAAIDALAGELRVRNARNPNELTPAMQDGLRWMAMAARAIANEGI